MVLGAVSAGIHLCELATMDYQLSQQTIVGFPESLLRWPVTFGLRVGCCSGDAIYNTIVDEACQPFKSIKITELCTDIAAEILAKKSMFNFTSITAFCC